MFSHSILMGVFHIVVAAIVFLLVDTTLMGMSSLDNKWYNRYSRLIALTVAIVISYGLHYVLFHM